VFAKNGKLGSQIVLLFRIVNWDLEGFGVQNGKLRSLGFWFLEWLH
jgi:hypothetical protein